MLPYRTYSKDVKLCNTSCLANIFPATFFHHWKLLQHRKLPREHGNHVGHQLNHRRETLFKGTSNQCISISKAIWHKALSLKIVLKKKRLRMWVLQHIVPGGTQGSFII